MWFDLITCTLPVPGFCKSDKEQNSLSFLVADCFTKLCKSILVFPDSKISRGKPKTIQIVKASSLYNYIFCTRTWYSICKPGQANLHHWNCIEFFDHLQKIFFENNKHSLVKFGWIRVWQLQHHDRKHNSVVSRIKETMLSVFDFVCVSHLACKISWLYRHRTQQVHQAFLNEIAELGEVCKSPPWSQHFDPTLPPITTWKIQPNEVWCLPKGPCDNEALLPFLEVHHAVPLHFQHHVPDRWVNNCASLAEMNVLLQNSCGSLYGPMSSKLARVSLLCHLKTTRTNSKTTSFPIVQQHLHLSDLSCLCGSSTSLSLQRCWPRSF